MASLPRGEVGGAVHSSSGERKHMTESMQSATREGGQESGAARAITEMGLAKCERCLRPRYTVRLSQYELHRESTGATVTETQKVCGSCRIALGATVVAPEASPSPSIVDVAVARVELVAARLTPREQLAAAVGAGVAVEGDLPCVLPDPEICS